jgi:hypothetical protein
VDGGDDIRAAWDGNEVLFFLQTFGCNWNGGAARLEGKWIRFTVTAMFRWLAAAEFCLFGAVPMEEVALNGKPDLVEEGGGFGRH